MTSPQGKRVIIASAVVTCLVAALGGVALNYVAGPPDKAAQVSKEEPTLSVGSSVAAPAPGCWTVALTNDTELSATWAPTCPGVPKVTLGPREWLTKPLQLPALSLAPPALTQAQTRAVISEEQALHGAGAMLFLPASADGSGYYVAAWVADHADDSDEPTPKGLQLGLYSAPPTSVAVPHDRVYLTPQSPLQFFAGEHQDAEDEGVERDSDSDV